MSAAVNRPHDVLSSRPHLPLTGELHPLRREFERLLAVGNMVTLTFALVACSIIYFWPQEAVKDVPEFVKRRIVNPSPPPIDPTGRNDTNFEPPAPVVRGIYVPADPDSILADPAAPEEDGGSGEGDPNGSGDPFNGWEPGDTIVVREQPAQPSQVHDWWDEAPVFLSCEPPVYPNIVREAGIDGTVMVRVLVGVNGKVKDAYVVDGPSVLRHEALKSARTAIFKPALVGVHPVEVWVVIPVTFELRDRR